MTSTRSVLSFAVAVTVLLGAGGAAWASDADELLTRLNAVRESLAVLSVDPMADAARLEIERTDIDIDEARDRITNRQIELAEVSVIRLENRVKFVEALIFQATVDALAEERESATIEMTREADQAQVEYEATQARQAALRDEVQGILDQLQVTE
jgi:hypothetical protein